MSLPNQWYREKRFVYGTLINKGEARQKETTRVQAAQRIYCNTSRGVTYGERADHRGINLEQQIVISQLLAWLMDSTQEKTYLQYGICLHEGKGIQR